MHVEPSHWLHETSIPKTICHHFWCRLMVGANLTKEKIIIITHPTAPKEKTWAHHECMLNLPIGCMKSFFPKLLVTIFYLS
jgi:hypothetical protein